MLSPRGRQDQQEMIRFHTKALQVLQKALADEKTCLDQDVLCASEMLSMYEVDEASLAAQFVVLRLYVAVTRCQR